ncbi:MAG: ABC transporter ATP-binding protein, partial [Parafannyhessea umbonata]
MRRFLGYYQGQMHLFVGDIACAVVVAGIDLAFPQILRTLTGGLFTQGADAILGALGYLAAGLLAMYAVRFACRYFVAYWGHVMGARMESRMREDLFAAYQRMSFSFFDRNKSGDLMSRLVSDLFDISETAHHGPEFLLIGAVEIVGSFVILGFVNVPLTLVLAAVLVVLTAYNLRANLRMKAIFRENRVRISGVNSRVEDSLAGIRVVKGFAAEDVEKDKFRTSNDAYLDSKVRMYRAMGTYQAGIAALMGALYTVIVCLGGWLIAKGQMQPQDLATFALYITLFTTPIDNILNFTETFQKAIAG